MGNGVWTVEIIPAEIQPPARSVAGASGNRIRIGSKRVTNGGDETDLVVAFNEQVLLGRVRAGELKPGCTILLEDMWRDETRSTHRFGLRRDLRATGRGRLPGLRDPDGARMPNARLPMPRRGKNMFALGMLCNIYSLDMRLWRASRSRCTFGKKCREGHR